MDLNEEQERAASHVEGPLLVLAGAGSGKTRVVTQRIVRLIDLGVPPSDILAVTFTNKGAGEMRSRIRALKNAQVLTCTFHSLGARILRESISYLGYRSDFAIYDEEDSEKLLKNCFEQLQFAPEKGVLKDIRNQISSAKNSLLDPDKVNALENQLLAKVYPVYQNALKSCNALDFDDLLYLTVKLLQQEPKARQEYQNRWQFVLIDEYQDTNFAQYTLAKLLVEKHGNLFAVGDPDQSIYSWRGARYQNILNFERDFPGAKVVVLDQNYRSTNTILEATNALIEHNPNRYEKKLWSASGNGEKIGVYMAYNERQEAEFVAGKILHHVSQQRLSLNDIAIFYRTNAQSRPFEDALLAKRIDYSIIGGISFYARREIKDVLAFLRLILSNTDLISFLRTINLPKRGFGPAALDKLVAAAAAKSQPILSFCEHCVNHGARDFKLNAKQQSGLQNYLRLIQKLRDLRASMKIHELISTIIEDSGYLEYLKEDPETQQDRKENLDELIGKSAEWEEERKEPTLQAFLEELTLRSNVEEKADLPTVKLMTLHNSKGLEFPLVFLVGLEEDICPHINSKDNVESLEEERRLCYVGMTRARQFLYLTASSFRFMWGVVRPMQPSRFLKEIPAKFLQNLSAVSRPSSVSRVSTECHGSVDEEHSDDEGFSVGEEVVHSQFGVGVIQKVSHGSFGLTYEVHFSASDTTRTLVAKFAKLRLA
ncbi:MAG TPA: UvrD-helicase domain-containing protein [Chlamydiales bacterium]|jgi:DNA helicase-2/ATP-dependent DNA helicase PcrA|nr:UvrD-helicase domain-containing protein [Chlamydiales bacterium]